MKTNVLSKINFRVIFIYTMSIILINATIGFIFSPFYDVSKELTEIIVTTGYILAYLVVFIVFYQFGKKNYELPYVNAGLIVTLTTTIALSFTSAVYGSFELEPITVIGIFVTGLIAYVGVTNGIESRWLESDAERSKIKGR